MTSRIAPLLLLLAGSVQAQTSPDDLHPGPSEIRDEHVLAQPRLTLTALSPATTPAGEWSLGFSTLWSNSFSWDQDVPGEYPGHRSYLMDAETFTLDATLRHGLSRNLEVGLRLPLRWRGGGILDGLIDAWHNALDLPNGGRPYFPRNAFQVEGTTTTGQSFSWTDAPGAGLGDIELQTRWRFVDGGSSSPSLALVGRLSLPTGTGPYAGNSAGAAGQLVLGVPLSRRFDLYAGLGGSLQGSGPVRGVEYEPARVHAFLALEWRAWRRVSLLAETNAANRLVANIESYPGTHWLLNVTGRIDLGRRTRLDLGFTENIKDQLSTTDFAIYSALAFRR